MLRNADGSWQDVVTATGRNQLIGGMTTLNGRLYVNFTDTDCIEIYDIADNYSRLRRLAVPGLGSVVDMASCVRHRCVYVAHGNAAASAGDDFVTRVDEADTTLMTKWSAKTSIDGMSTTLAGDVLLACGATTSIRLFTTDGVLIRTVQLPPHVVHLSHAVELSADQFLICHGTPEDATARLCVVNGAGDVSHSARDGSLNLRGGHFIHPVRLAANGLIFVIDRHHGVLEVFSPTLNYVRRMSVPGLQQPHRIWFDRQADRLYVAYCGRANMNDDKAVRGRIKVCGI